MTDFLMSQVKTKGEAASHALRLQFIPTQKASTRSMPHLRPIFRTEVGDGENGREDFPFISFSYSNPWCYS